MQKISILVFFIIIFFISCSRNNETKSISIIENNQKIHWVPDHVKQGRFGKWLEGARDWDFARNRFWGAPIPIWVCEKCGHMECVGSIAELDKLKILNFFNTNHAFRVIQVAVFNFKIPGNFFIILLADFL